MTLFDKKGNRVIENRWLDPVARGLQNVLFLLEVRCGARNRRDATRRIKSDRCVKKAESSDVSKVAASVPTPFCPTVADVGLHPRNTYNY